MNVCINKEERLDETGFGNLKLIQKPEDFCYGIDAVLLASFAAEKAGARILDLGTGTGIVPILLSHKTRAEEIVGIELQQDAWERGQRNIQLNELQKRVKILLGDVKDALSMKDIEAYSFDTVVTNPPYVKKGGGIKNSSHPKTIARHELSAELSDFIEVAASMLKDRGDFYMVHRPDRLVDIAVLCRQYKLEPKEIRLVSPNKEGKPNILLVHCIKHGKPELKFLDPLYVYDEKGGYTAEILEIYERS